MENYLSAANFICAPGARRRAWPRADRCRQWSGGVARQNFRSLAARRISFSAFSLPLMLMLRAHPRLHLEFAQTFIDHPHHPQGSPSRRPPRTPAHAFYIMPSTLLHQLQRAENLKDIAQRTFFSALDVENSWL